MSAWRNYKILVKENVPLCKHDLLYKEPLIKIVPFLCKD